MTMAAEELMRSVIDIIILAVEMAGACVVAVGSLMTLWQTMRGWVHRDGNVLSLARISFGRALALGLEFQLAGDILKTAVSPSWDAIGRLAAIATIRTMLNYFLAREIFEGEKTLPERPHPPRIDMDPAATPAR